MGDATIAAIRDQQLEAARLSERGEIAASFALLDRMLRAHPDDASLHNQRATLLTQIGELAQGQAAAARALALQPRSPHCAYTLARNLLAQGRYAEAWPLYRARLDAPDLASAMPRDFPFPRWEGEPIDGLRIAIFPEQGWGDQIMVARFLPEIAARAAAVTLLSPPPLVRLFRHSLPDVMVMAADGPVAFDDPDLWLMTGDLPVLAQATPDTLWQRPYLSTPVAPPDLGRERAIGVMAKGNPRFAHDARRSLDGETARTLIGRLPGRVIDLDPAATGAADFADTAALIAALDLVVSVDTAVAHLAGALGKDCRLLVPGFATDWRWMRGRDTSPWYPHHRLYRGTVDGSWGDAIDRLVSDLAG